MDNGYYWVCYLGEWQIGHLFDGYWRLFYVERWFKDIDFDYVSDKKLVYGIED